MTSGIAEKTHSTSRTSLRPESCKVRAGQETVTHQRWASVAELMSPSAAPILVLPC